MPGEKLLEKSRKFVALEDISFELRKGETIGIVGESGCGKTTLGQLICGIQTKSDGNIQYAEKSTDYFSGSIFFIESQNESRRFDCGTL